MDISIMEKKSLELKTSTQKIINNYQKIVDSLNSIYLIIYKKDKTTANEIKQLINEYNSFLRTLRSYLSLSVDGIYQYFKNTKVNISNLSTNLNQVSRLINNMSTSIDSKELNY